MRTAVWSVSWTFAILTTLLAHLAPASAAPPAPAAVPTAAAPSEKKPEVTWEGLPGAVRDAIKREFGSTTPPEKLKAKPGKDGSLEYSAGGDVGVRKVSLKVSASGSVISKREKETLDAKKLPKAIAAAIKKETGGAQVLEAVKDTKDGEVEYAIKAETKARKIQLTLAGNGAFIDKKEKRTEEAAAAKAAPGPAKK